MSSLINSDVAKYTMEKVYPISIFEADRQYSLKLAVLLNFMQDLAANSIEMLGHKYRWDELFKKGLGWFLIRYRIEFDDYPINLSSIKIRTETRGASRLNTFRDFEGYDVLSGKRLFRAVSSWFIVDLDNKAVLNISQEYPDFRKYEKREDDLVLRKIKPFEDPTAEKLFHVRYDDLDINGHVNNTVYVTWAMEALDYDFRTTHKLKNLDIYFKHEVRYGEDVISVAKIDIENNVSEHLIKNAQTGEEVCLLKAEYVNF